jgi:hypothetical protein
LHDVNQLFSLIENGWKKYREIFNINQYLEFLTKFETHSFFKVFEAPQKKKNKRKKRPKKGIPLEDSKRTVPSHKHLHNWSDEIFYKKIQEKLCTFLGRLCLLRLISRHYLNQLFQPGKELV